jgi:hypothetical protein
MAQEFTIKSQDIEDKINQLLPSQGGFQAGVDFSASTMVVPIVDLTETAEGSNVRQDLQRAISLDSITAYNVENTTTTVWNTTGYILMQGYVRVQSNSEVKIQITDGITSKNIVNFDGVGTGANGGVLNYSYVILVKAGESIVVNANSNQVMTSGYLRQIADLSGNLIQPT